MANHDKPETMATGPDAALIVENDELPEMRPAETLITMDDASAIETLSAAAEGDAMSESAPEGQAPDTAEAAAAAPGAYADMEPLSAEGGGAEIASGVTAADFAAGEQGEAYLRLVVHVDQRVMTVIDGSVISGPSAVDPDLTGAMVYQATVDGRRVGAGAFADLREIHSLAPPDDPDKGHHHAILDSFDFIVRIPREELALEDLKRLKVELFTTHETTEISQTIAPAPGETFQGAAAARALDTPPVYSTIDGISLDNLPSAAAESIRKNLR